MHIRPAAGKSGWVLNEIVIAGGDVALQVRAAIGAIGRDEGVPQIGVARINATAIGSLITGNRSVSVDPAAGGVIDSTSLSRNSHDPVAGDGAAKQTQGVGVKNVNSATGREIQTVRAEATGGEIVINAAVGKIGGTSVEKTSSITETALSVVAPAAGLAADRGFRLGLLTGVQP